MTVGGTVVKWENSGTHYGRERGSGARAAGTLPETALPAAREARAATSCEQNHIHFIYKLEHL